jgi:hypothetical protein
MIEEILVENGKGETNTIVMGTGTSWLEKNHTETLLNDMDWEGEIRDQFIQYYK